MKLKVNLTNEDILEKKFTINIKGYDVNQVDFFLDLIKKDYESWEVINKERNKQITEKDQRIEFLEKRIKVLENHNQIVKKELGDLQDKGLSNMDIIQRLNKLEEK